MELGNLIATPISRAMLYILASKGVKRPQEELASINPYGQIIESAVAKKTFSQEFATTFLDLVKEGRVPGWVLQSIDVELLKLAR